MTQLTRLTAANGFFTVFFFHRRHFPFPTGYRATTPLKEIQVNLGIRLGYCVQLPWLLFCFFSFFLLRSSRHASFCFIHTHTCTTTEIVFERASFVWLHRTFYFVGAYPLEVSVFSGGFGFRGCSFLKEEEGSRNL